MASNSSLEGMIAKYTGTGFLHEIREQLEKVVTTVFHGKYVGGYDDIRGRVGRIRCATLCRDKSAL